MSTFQQTQTTSRIGIAKKGQNTFSKFYDKFAPFFFTMLARSTGDRFLSEELLQQVFKQTWQLDQESVTTEQSLFARTSRFARHLAQENASTNKFERELINIDHVVLKEIDKFDCSVDDTLLRLICIKGCTLQEASQQLGCSEGDFKNRLREECNRIRASINE
jgi:DNA-directed RNA polymerase specialized sigma24 family protein